MRYNRQPMRRAGYTLVELLLSTALGLLVLAAVIQMFSVMGGTINDSRAALAMNEDLRRVAAQLRSDLDGLTVIPDPPRPPENGEGYLQIIEGPMGPSSPGYMMARDTDFGGAPDTTVSDTDDIILFTSRKEEGFRARVNGTVETFDAAEVAWFMRGNKLYRKVRGIDADLSAVRSETLRYTLAPADRGNVSEFFHKNDISMNAVTAMDGSGDVIYERNTLASLTRPDCRYGAQWDPSVTGNNIGLLHFAYGAAGTGGVWCPPTGSGMVPGLGLPLASEVYVDTEIAATSGDPWKIVTPADYGTGRVWDLWRDPMPWDGVERFTGGLKSIGGVLGENWSPPTGGTNYFVDPDRSTEELMLSNVLGFDVKVWDPTAPVCEDPTASILVYPGDPGWGASSNVRGAGAFVDLGYAATNLSDFSDVRSFSRTESTAHDATGTWTAPAAVEKELPRVYDTWSTHLEAELNVAGGLQFGAYKYAAPYMKRLRGIQVTVRAFEPDSRQVRQITLVHAFPQS